MDIRYTLYDKDKNKVEIIKEQDKELFIYETVNGATVRADSMLIHKDIDKALTWYKKWGFS